MFLLGLIRINLKLRIIVDLHQEGIFLEDEAAMENLNQGRIQDREVEVLLLSLGLDHQKEVVFLTISRTSILLRARRNPSLLR